MDRKHFVITMSASAFAALAWLRGAGLPDAIATSAAEEPKVKKAALGIIRAILPFEHPRFPSISAADIHHRMYALFALDNDASFAATLALFNSIGAWSNPPKAVVEIETALNGPPDLAHDVRLLESWSSAAAVNVGSFSELALANQRSYLTLWANSALGVRRRIYQSLKALVNATAYSTEALWSAIEYEGPLITRALSS